jgi:hypothetical protein
MIAAGAEISNPQRRPTDSSYRYSREVDQCAELKPERPPGAKEQVNCWLFDQRPRLHRRQNEQQAGKT